MKYLSFGIFLLFTSFNLLASGSQVGNWWMYFGNNKIADKVTLHNEIQYRNYEFGDLEQLLIRGGLAYNVQPNKHNVLLGYAYIHSEPYNFDGIKIITKEHRPFLQYIFRGRWQNLSHTHRGRFEYRHRDNLNDVTRFRYFISLSYPIWAHQTKFNSIYATAYNEFFIHFKQYNAFDRNRVFGGLGYQINKDLKFEIGYMSQLLRTQATHQVTLGFYNNLSFTRKNK